MTRFVVHVVTLAILSSSCAGGDEVDESDNQPYGGGGAAGFGGSAGFGAGGMTSGGGGSGGAAGSAGVSGAAGTGAGGGDPTNDCCTPASSPGCTDAKVSACVCSNEPYCCTTSWHPMCVVSVNTYACGNCSIPGSGGGGSGGGGGTGATGGGGGTGASGGSGGSGGTHTGGSGGTSSGGSGGSGGTPQCTGAKAFECGGSDYQCSSAKCVKCSAGTKNCNGLLGCECGTTCSGTSCSTCSDPGPEPNNTLASASSACPTSVCSINDCDVSGSSVSGVIKPGGDADFFKFSGTDGVCVVGPGISTTTAGIQACVFAQCADASDGFKSCTQGTQATEGTLKGCCTSTAGSAEINLDCASWTDSATVYVRVKGTSTTACTPYDVAYHY